MKQKQETKMLKKHEKIKCERAKKAKEIIKKFPQYADLLESYYGENMISICVGGIIDFSPDSVKDVVYDKKLTYNKYLEAQFKAIETNCRTGLIEGYLGAEMRFKGTISEINSQKVCFNRLYIDGCRSDGTCFEEKEDHVWIDKKEFKKFKKGDCVEFDAEVYRYLRVKNQTIDFGLRNPSFIEKIGEYDLPTEQELYEQFLQQVRCETCLLSDHCDRIFCLKE